MRVFARRTPEANKLEKPGPPGSNVKRTLARRRKVKPNMRIVPLSRVVAAAIAHGNKVPLCINGACHEGEIKRIYDDLDLREKRPVFMTAEAAKERNEPRFLLVEPNFIGNSYETAYRLHKHF